MTNVQLSNYDLEEVIRSSPVELVDGYYYVHKAPYWNIFRIFAKIADGFETTIVTRSRHMRQQQAGGKKGPFRLLRLRISKPFEAPGFLAAACKAVAEEQLSVLVLSTFSFDYLLIRDADTEIAVEALVRRGFGRDTREGGARE